MDVTNDVAEIERRIESEDSSSAIVVRATIYGLSITLDPMNHPVEKIDVYEEEAEAFADAVDDLSEIVGGECGLCETDADVLIEFEDDSWGLFCEDHKAEPLVNITGDAEVMEIG